MMAYITWLDLIDIATLVIAIVSLVLSNKKDNRPHFPKRGYL